MEMEMTPGEVGGVARTSALLALAPASACGIRGIAGCATTQLQVMEVGFKGKRWGRVSRTPSGPLPLTRGFVYGEGGS